MVAWIILALVVAVALAYAFMRVDARRLASGLQTAGPFVLGGAGVILLLLGRGAVGGLLLPLAIAWYTRIRAQRRATSTPGKVSRVRTAALEMELDHDTGGLDGLVLAGTLEGRRLAALDLAELLTLRRQLAGDGESLQLLETYLDGRFPAWRDDPQADAHEWQGSAPGSGAMTQQEAYQVLGLEPGASTAEIRKAHRRLMQRLHPDLGGSSFLAARINAAKDVLLSRQH